MFNTPIRDLTLFEAIAADPAERRDHHYNLLMEVFPYYNQLHRYFHDWYHIVQGARLAIKLAEDNDEFDLTMAQQVAWLFHDIVYVPPGKAAERIIGANESQSVSLFESIALCPRLNIENLDSFGYVVIPAILDTIHHVPTRSESNAILDLDLANFRDAKLFEKGTVTLRKEFRVYTDREFYIGQASFLKTFLDREFIYSTKFARTHWEEEARKNLRLFISKVETEYQTLI